jgi:hypothetical protein
MKTIFTARNTTGFFRALVAASLVVLLNDARAAREQIAVNTQHLVDIDRRLERLELSNQPARTPPNAPTTNPDGKGN